MAEVLPKGLDVHLIVGMHMTDPKMGYLTKCHSSSMILEVHRAMAAAANAGGRSFANLARAGTLHGPPGNVVTPGGVTLDNAMSVVSVELRHVLLNVGCLHRSQLIECDAFDLTSNASSLSNVMFSRCPLLCTVMQWSA